MGFAFCDLVYSWATTLFFSWWNNIWHFMKNICALPERREPLTNKKSSLKLPFIACGNEQLQGSVQCPLQMHLKSSNSNHCHCCPSYRIWISNKDGFSSLVRDANTHFPSSQRLKASANLLHLISFIIYVSFICIYLHNRFTVCPGDWVYYIKPFCIN